MNVGSVANSSYGYLKRIAKLYPNFVLGTGSEAFTETLKNTVKNRGSQGYFSSVWGGIKKGVVESEKVNNKLIKNEGGFFKATWKAIKTTPSKIQAGWRLGGIQATKAGKTGLSKFWSQSKGALKGLGKRMPLIGTLLIAVTEIPNIFSAFKDKGIIGGVTETAKSGLRLGAGMTGGAIGAALLAPIPVVGSILGSLVGYMAGDWLMSKITGKSHSEKKAELEEKVAQADQQAAYAQQLLAQQQMMPQMYGNQMYGNQMYANASNPFAVAQPTMSQQELMAMQNMLYNQRVGLNDDFMAAAYGMNNKLNYMG